MRLVGLNPRWWSDPGRHGQGITFDCPCAKCRTGPEKTRLSVAFAQPLDDGAPSTAISRPLYWQRTGDSFETLTLTPSIDASAGGHWHGFITNGEIR